MKEYEGVCSYGKGMEGYVGILTVNAWELELPVYHLTLVTCTCGLVLAKGPLAKLQQLPANQVSDCPFYLYNLNMQYTFTGYRGKITENIQCNRHSCTKSHES